MPARNSAPIDTDEHAAPDDHQDRRRNDHREHRRHRGDRDREADVVALLDLRLDEDLALARGVGRRRARDAGEEDRQHDVDLREAAREVADQRARQRHQPVGDAADVHQVRGQQEERHRQQDERVVGLEGLVESASSATAAARSAASAGRRGRARTRPARAATSARRTRRTGSGLPATGDSTAPLIMLASRARCASCRANCSPRKTSQVDAGQRPRDVDEPHRQLGELGGLVPARTATNSMPYQTNTSANTSTNSVGDQLQQRVGARLQSRPDVDVEMRAFAHADHRAEHDHPDEEEARHLLGPDVRTGSARCSARRSAADRDDQDRDGRDQQPLSSR